MWKAIYKKTLIEDKKRVKKDVNKGFAYDHSSKIVSNLIEKLEPMLITKLIFSFITSHPLDILLFNNYFKTVYDCTYLSLPLNQLQHLIVEAILNHAIKNKEKIYFESNQQLLIYVKGEVRVGKSRVMKNIKMSFTLLSKRNELVIFAPIGSAANEISGNIIHISIRVNTQVEKNHEVKVNVK